MAEMDQALGRVWSDEVRQAEQVGEPSSELFLMGYQGTQHQIRCLLRAECVDLRGTS